MRKMETEKDNEMISKENMPRIRQHGFGLYIIRKIVI